MLFDSRNGGSPAPCTPFVEDIPMFMEVKHDLSVKEACLGEIEFLLNPLDWRKDI